MGPYDRGWVEAHYLYRCRWCEREETVVVTRNTGFTLDWIFNPQTGGMDLCSTDCLRERDACITQAYANVEPIPEYSGNYPPGYHAEYERLRHDILKKRSLDARIKEI